jgi:hypothetical protein
MTGIRPIASIIGDERFRKGPGDISGLAKSMAEIGLLHPIVITPDNGLIAGERCSIPSPSQRIRCWSLESHDVTPSPF